MAEDQSREEIVRLLMAQGSGGFNDTYKGTPPWDIGRPQPAFVELADAGAVRGRVLDIGCGTGEHALMAAALGLDATGIDSAPRAIELARAKARERGLAATFLVGDALDLTGFDDAFETVFDCGLFHVFSDEDRSRYATSLARVTARAGQVHILCFSDRQPGDFGPRRVTQDELRDTFRDGWRVDDIVESRLNVTNDPLGAAAWRVTLTRVE